MFTQEALQYYKLRAGSKHDHDLPCQICGHLMEDPVITTCGHKFDFGCITIQIHLRDQLCPEQICGKSLRSTHGSNTMPSTGDLVKYTFRMGRMTDFIEKCEYCHNNCKDPVYAVCGHLFCFICIANQLHKPDGRCPVKGCVKGKELRKYYDTNNPGPPRFAQADQDEASFALFQKLQKMRYDTFQAQVIQQQQIATARHNSMLLYQNQMAHLERQMRHMHQMQRLQMQAQLDQAKKRAADMKTERLQAEKRQVEATKEAEKLWKQGAGYSDRGLEEFREDRRKYLSSRADCVVHIDCDLIIKTMHGKASTLPNYKTISTDPAYADALNDVLYIWERKLRRRDGFEVYRKDFLESLGVAGERVIYQQGYLSYHETIPQGFWDFLHGLALEAAHCCKLRQQAN